MTKYIKKPIEVEAIQYTGENEAECLDFLFGTKKTPMRRKFQNSLHKEVGIGWWFISENGAWERTISNESFQEQYQAVEG